VLPHPQLIVAMSYMDEVIASQVCYFILVLANLLRRFATQGTMP